MAELHGTDVLGATAQMKRDLGEVAVARLLRTASRQVVYSGQTVLHSGQWRRAGILVHGLLRSFVTFPGGESATVDYMRGPGFYGLTSLFRSSPTSIDALRTSTVLVLDAETVLGMAADGPGFALYVARQLASEVAQIPDIVEDFAVLTVRERVAAHLLALSERETPTGPRVAHITQQLLAEFVCSAREVVARCLRALREEGLVTPVRNAVYIIDEAGLASLASRSTGAPIAASAIGRRAAS